MSDEIHAPTIQQSVSKLRGFDEYKVLVSAIRGLREESLADLSACKDPYEVMKLAGGAARMDELLSLLDG